MRQWQRVLEEFVLNRDPMTAELYGLEIPPADRVKNVDMLLERGWLAPAGVIYREDQTVVYQATPAGREEWHSAMGKPSKRPSRAPPLRTRTLAEEMQATHPVDVFDLARVHIPWSAGDRAE